MNTSLSFFTDVLLTRVREKLDPFEHREVGVKRDSNCAPSQLSVPLRASVRVFRFRELVCRCLPLLRKAASRRRVNELREF